jgi:hypothetical protein
MFSERGSRQLQLLLNLRRSKRLKTLHNFAGCWIDGRYRHGDFFPFVWYLRPRLYRLSQQPLAADVLWSDHTERKSGNSSRDARMRTEILEQIRGAVREVGVKNPSNFLLRVKPGP